MKKRFLSTLMALCLALSLLPATALAVEEGDASGAAGGEPTGSEIQATRAIEETDVAAIGDQGYATLSAAMSAAKDGETVRLLKETSEASQIYIYGEKITLDLNGYTLTTTATKNFLNLYNTNGKLTITDESESGGGKIVSPSGDFIFNIVSGALEIQKVTVQANGFWTYNGSKYGNTIVCLTGAAASNPGATNHATFTLGSDAKLLCADTSDGESIGPGYSVMVDYNGTASYGVVVDIYGTTEHAGLYVNGTIKETSGNVPSFTLHDGAYIDGGIYAAGYAKWDIDGATVIGETGIEIRAGELTVEEGSVITGTATPTRVEPNGNGSTTLGAGIAVAQHTTKLPISVTINGGDISGFTALYQSNPQDNGEEDVAKVQMDVKGGDYTAINGGRNSVYSENKTGFITGGSFSNDVSQYVPNSGEGGGMSVTDDGDGNFTVSVSKDAVAEVNSVGYTTLQAAINAANDGDTVTLLKEVTITDTITIDKDITVTAVEGATVTAKTDGHSFVLSNGATLDGLTVELADGYSVNIVQMGNDSTVKNCKFTGGYSLETDGTSGETSRAIEGSSGKLTITGNTFENLRQPAYINACTGEISNNYVSGTRGWVICGNSNMEITGNTFGTNAVDIAIIDDNAGDSTNTNNYAEKIAELSESNNGAYTQNQLSMVEAEDGALVVGKSDGYTLDKALAAAQEGDTVRLLDNVDVTAPISLPEGVTLDGGNHAINYTGKKKTDNPSVLVLAGQGADGVTVQNVTLNTNGNLKHGVEFFAADNGKLSNVTVNGGSYTAVQNNGSTGLVIVPPVLSLRTVSSTLMRVPTPTSSTL